MIPILGTIALSAITRSGMAGALFNAVTTKMVTKLSKKPEVLGKTPGVGPDEMKTPVKAEKIAEEGAKAALETIAQSEDVTLVKIKPMSKSVEGWAAVTGMVSLVANYAPNILQQVGININEGLGDAVESVTRALGLPAGTGKAAVVIITLGSFVVVWVRKKWFSHTVTPAAANRAVAQGKAL